MEYSSLKILHSIGWALSCSPVLQECHYTSVREDFSTLDRLCSRSRAAAIGHAQLLWQENRTRDTEHLYIKSCEGCTEGATEQAGHLTSRSAT